LHRGLARGEAGLRDQLARLAQPLARALESQPFLLGTTPTLADAAVWGPLAGIETIRPGWIRSNLTVLPGLADLSGWYERVSTARLT
jgi:glutathione S-transferase